MSTYLTDSWSTISGLASVAYGSPDRYPEVANQVRSKSVTAFLSPITASDVVSDKLSPEDLALALQAEYDKGGNFSKYVDSGSQSLSEISSNLHEGILSAYNEMGSYEMSISDALEYVLPGAGIDYEGLAQKLLNSVSDLDLFSRLASSIPLAKLDKLPAGTRIELEDNISLDSDQNGTSLTSGYLTVSDYFNDIAYPGMGNTADNLPTNLIKSVSEGYRGYASLRPLDELTRPGFVALMSLADIRDINNVSRSIAGLGTLDTLRDLSGLGSMSDADRAMYEVDLDSLIVDMNGYTVYDPLNSNGDFAPQSVVFDNADPGSGLPPSTRPRTSPF